MEAERRHADRARQFMPFASLRGYYDYIREQERVREPRRELSEDGAQTAAQALLGAKAALAGESGYESTYESELGTLHITRTGGFSAVMRKLWNRSWST